MQDSTRGGDNTMPQKSLFSSFVLPLVLLLAGIFAIWLGVDYNDKRNTYIQTTAVITNIYEEHYDDSTDYEVTVTYTIEDQQYTTILGEYITGFYVGEEIQSFYSPHDPTDVIADSLFLLWVYWVLGGLMLLASVFMSLRLIIPLILFSREGKANKMYE